MMTIRVKTKQQAKQFTIDACRRQYGFAPKMKDVHIDAYNTERIIFHVLNKQYLIKMYKDFPLVTMINFICGHDF